MKASNLLFPHQLFQQHELYSNGHPTYLVEEALFFKEFNFHKIKLAFHRASMKSHAAYLKESGVDLRYISSDKELSDIRKLLAFLAKEGVQQVNYIDPTDCWLERRIEKTALEQGLLLNCFENRLFINSKEDLKSFFKAEKKSFFQTTFYKQQRVKRNILIDQKEQPVGGKWSFDADNRKKYPKGKTPPSIHFPKKDAYWEEAMTYVETFFPDNLGQLPTVPKYPYHHSDTAAWLDQFFATRFQDFGLYEDAIVDRETFLNHSLLSPLLNVGLFTPMEIVEKAVLYAKKNDIPLNSLEGFVRQIIGWREFIRGMYECKGVVSRNANFWGFERKIPASFYNGTTGIDPVDDTIKKVLKEGYCHHIERLMVLGNFMLLCEFHPTEVYRWFMELFVDAYDWVMVPNVYGMSQFADGGFFATKPYISGSNYILKMSNYKKGPWQSAWDGLFWRFMHVNRTFFLKNPRLGMLVRTYDKMTDEKKQVLQKNAEDFLRGLDLENEQASLS